MNLKTENNFHLNTMPLFNHRLACLVSRLYGMQVHNMTENNFSEPETDAKARKKKYSNIVLFDSLKNRITWSQKSMPRRKSQL